MFSGDLGKGMIVLFITMNLFNFFNFLFHFSMGRLLGPANYGILAVLMSIVYLYGIPIEALQNIMSRYTTKFSSKKEYGKIKFLMKKSLRKATFLSIILFFILIPVAFFVSEFLKINFWLILLTNLLIFFSFLTPITRGILQGRKEYTKLGLSLIIESIIKLLLAVLLVTIGMQVFGAIIGLLIGISSGLIFSFYFNKDILGKKEEKSSFHEIYSESIPYFISMLVIFLFLNLDIILAKRFFSPDLAGKYSVLSMLGKVIFFGTAAIGKAMFPITSEKHDNNQSSSSSFKKSLLVIFLLCLSAVLVYLILPEIVISILYGKQYLEMAPYLVYSGIALSLLSFSNLILIYGLSTNKIKKPQYLFIFLIIDVILLFSFHENIGQYILAFMFSNLLMFTACLISLKRK